MTPPPEPRPHHDKTQPLSPDAGGASLFALGLGVCAAMLIAGGVSVTATQLARSDILDAAAHASASAADRISEASIYRDGAQAVRLNSAQTQREAARVLAATPLPRHVSSWAVSSVTVNGDRVSVSVRAVVKPPVIGSALAALGEPVIVDVSSTADAHLAEAQ